MFRSPRDVGEAVQDAISLLQVPRSALGITASSKGLVAGRLVIHDQRTGGWVLEWLGGWIRSVQMLFAWNCCVFCVW